MLETAIVSSTGFSAKLCTTDLPPPTLGLTSSTLIGGEAWDAEGSPVKLECPDAFDTVMLSESTDFAELKPLPFDYGVDPLVNNNNNNNNNNLPSKPDLNIRSPNSTTSSRSYYSDVTSSGCVSPGQNKVGRSTESGVTTSIKLELDFTASQDAFDDLASIVGISMGADSTVPNIDGDQEWSDLDAWIENTAQNIKPLNGGGETENGSTSTQMTSSPYLINTAGSTLHSILSGSPSIKMTQLIQRDSPSTTTATAIVPPPPYSILHNRLTHGGKVEGSFYTLGSSNSVDSLPHSTSLGNAACLRSPEFKAKKAKGVRQKPVSSSSSSSSSGSASPPLGLDGGKKMMHHCHICNRGFLNKSNIKVHLRTHTGEKPFKCEHCSKAFRQKAHLLKHMSIHKRISRD